MFRLARLLTTLLAFTLFAANSASAITTVSAEKPASGLFGVPEQRVGIDALVSSDRVGEKLSLLYDFASDFPVAAKAINLPAWRHVTVNMKHIAERHIAGGPLTAGKTVFPGMDQTSVMRAVRQAYESSAKAGVQGTDRVKLVGEGSGLTIEMWFNKVTKTIESAYPINP